MIKSRLLLLLLIFFLIGDISFSFIQYYNTPLFGDLTVSILPEKYVQQIFNDPFGFEILKTGEKQFNPNRFFSHFFLNRYFRSVPFFLQKILSPISSVYFASALAKILIQILLIYILAAFISREKISGRKFLIEAIIIVPLFQAYGFWSRMGIIDKSIAYTFFYALPMVLLALFYLPVFRQIQNNKKIKPLNFLILVPLVFILPFTGPLNPPVILLVTGFIYIDYWFRSEDKNIVRVLRRVPGSIHFLLVPISLFSLYSLFIGLFDASFANESIPLLQRYKQLPEGLYSQLFHSPGFPLMLLIIGINMFIIKRNNYPEKRELTRFLNWIGIFTFIYVLLLPIGGYRPYRPLIIRYDTFIPVNIALFCFFGRTTYLIILQIKAEKRILYMSGIIIYLLLLTVADFKGIGKNTCERAALHKMAESDEKVVSLPNNCFVLGWSDEPDYLESEKKAELIYFWRITSEKKLFYNER